MNPLDLLTVGARIIDKIIPDPAQRAQAQLDLLKLHQNGELAELNAATQLATGQIEVNKVEAANASVWVSGWRPFIGWTLGGALFSQFILRPWVQWIAVFMGHPIPELPGIDDQLWQVLGGMLGLGTLRTVEKIKGITK